MKINPADVKVPLQKTVEVKNGVVEVSLSKRSDQAYKACQEFVSDYAAIVESTTVEEAVAEFVKYESAIIESSESAELTPAQKKLPPNVQKAIMEKMKKTGKKQEPENSETKKHESSETKKKESSEDMKKEQSAAQMQEDQMQEDQMQEDECDQGPDGEPCGKDSCAKCKSNASGQKTKNLTKDDYTKKM
jgi:hypothetical protein